MFDDAVDLFLREAAGVVEEIERLAESFRFERGEVGELRWVGEGGRGAAAEALEPDVFGAVHVDERVSHGGEAVARGLENCSSVSAEAPWSARLLAQSL